MNIGVDTTEEGDAMAPTIAPSTQGAQGALYTPPRELYSPLVVHAPQGGASTYVRFTVARYRDSLGILHTLSVCLPSVKSFVLARSNTGVGLKF